MVASADFDPRAAEYALNLQSSSDGVIVPGGDWLLTAEFARNGQDLTIRGADGVNAVVPDYFAGDAPPPLITDSGARLEGALVETLAGPRAPLQFADLQLAQASDATGAIGRVTAIEGVVQVSRADGSQAQLAEGDAVFLRDVIQAAADGKISIEFVDGTSFALSDGARMTLDELVFNPGGGNTFSASVLQGTFVFLTGQIAPSGEMNVTTPVGTIGVRGTKVVCKLAVEGQESTIMLLVDPDGHVGRVEVINGAGSQILSQANQATHVVSFFVAPSEPVILSEPELLQLFDEAIRMLDRSNGTTPGNEDQGGSSAGPESGDTAENAEQQLDEAAEALGEFETAAGEPTDLPQTFVPLPDFSFPDAPATTSFTTVTAGGDIQYASASYGDDSSGGDWQPADTRDTEEASAPPPPPPPSPYTVISGGSGDDTLGGGASSGQLQIFGNAGNDTLSGGTQADKLDGGDGDDTLDAGPGDDVVQGGSGNDLIIGGSGEGDDQLDGGANVDTVKYQSASQDIDVNLTTGKASGDPLIGNDTLINIENVLSGGGNDTIAGNGVANLLDGGAGDDKLAGLAGDDTLIGGAGDDQLAGGAGNDLLQGGTDDDTAIVSGNRSDYTVSLIGGQLVLTDQRPGGDGVDTLDGIESVQFADQTVTAVDLLGAANDAPTAILLSNDVVAEGAAGAVIGAVTVLDPDGGDTHTFTLSDDRFQIVGGQLVLAPGKSLDFEAEPTVSLEITATDAGGLSHSQTFTIHAADVNEAPSTPVDANAALDQVAENAANGTAVGIVASASDPESGDTVTYSLTDDAGGRFAIDANTGVVTVADGSLLNFETDSSHQITVQASSSGGLASTQDFTINVTNVNEPPGTSVDGNGAANQVAENAAAGTAVGITASASDPDSGDVVTYSLIDDAGGRFVIDANTGVITVADGGLLNFEAATSHQITVQASSSGGLTSSQSFTIAVTNVNEAPGAPVDVNAVANAVAEGAANGTPVGITVSATDPDAGDTVTYSLLDDAGGRFAIDANTGIVTVADGSLLNAADAASHEITVLASSSDGLSSSQSFTIAVTNVNEPPSIPVDNDGTVNQVAENAAPGALVGLTALSIDPDPSDPVVYSLTDDAGGRFAIDANTGVVTVANGASLDFEAATSHQITVQASSSGGLSASQTFTIDVTNVNEPPSP
ncbi:MAG: cadherin domain-containing protein, partial [Rhodospirillaceae bacterium]|nr:cadherin domain-containing protein [Rhodospirillaceae bacterium]